MCGSVASRQPTGIILSRLNSNTPTLFVPALSSSCAPALSSTPVISSEKLVAFIMVSGSARRRAHENALGIAHDYLHPQAGLLEFGENFQAHDRERVLLGTPAGLEFGKRRHPQLRFLLQAVRHFILVLDQGHSSVDIKRQRLLVGAHAVERHAGL